MPSVTFYITWPGKKLDASHNVKTGVQWADRMIEHQTSRHCAIVTRQS